ncbi:hypothetical protein A3Q56_00061 [Intoshia linei]|uniref:t-SNARE coiled-coil homology domain-containing protein n=1 Tax=Intoshia linei TaxID=1819745 RepID=A0A177BF30_9BILA|nr:hypothetical protein A3Q56_00061 [Intoshia linei]
MISIKIIYFFFVFFGSMNLLAENSNERNEQVIDYMIWVNIFELSMQLKYTEDAWNSDIFKTFKNNMDDFKLIHCDDNLAEKYKDKLEKSNLLSALYSSSLIIALIDCGLFNRLENLKVNIRKLLKSVRADITEIDNFNTNYQINLRMKNIHVNSLINAFTNLSNSFYQSEIKYKEQSKKMIEMKMEIVNDSSITRKDSNHNNLVFTNLLKETEQAKLSLCEVQKKHQQIENVSKNIEELHNVFQELNNMIHDQGIMIDNIEHNVEITVDYVEEASKVLNEATKLKAKTRRVHMDKDRCYNSYLCRLI